MKELLNKTGQAGPYQDTIGEYVIEIEPSDNYDEIIKEFADKDANRHWYETKFGTPTRLTNYKYCEYDFESKQVVNKELKGDLVLFTTVTPFTD